MPKPPLYIHFVRLHKRGLIGPTEAARWLIDTVDRSNVAEVISSLPPDLLSAIREEIAAAPATEADWEGVIFFRVPEADWPELRRIRRQRYDALRDFFARGGPT